MLRIRKPPGGDLLLIETCSGGQIIRTLNILISFYNQLFCLLLAIVPLIHDTEQNAENKDNKGVVLATQCKVSISCIYYIM
jgi:hypothetical protein